MNPNLEQLARETRDPSVLPELYGQQVGIPVMFMLDSCGQIEEELYNSIAQTAIDAMLRLRKAKISDFFSVINYGKNTYNVPWRTGADISDFQSVIEHYQGGIEHLITDSADTWMSKLHTKGAMLVISPGCNPHALNLAIEPVLEKGHFVGLVYYGEDLAPEDKRENVPENFQIYDVKESADEIRLAVEKFLGLLSVKLDEREAQK
jgi:hypothetical protein